MIHKILFVALMYVVCFNPAFNALFGIQSSFFLLPLLVLVVADKNVARLVLSYNKFIVPYVLLLVYVLFRVLVGGDSSFLISVVLMIIRTFFLSLIIVYLMLKKDVNFFKTIFIVSVIAGVISTICFFIPSIDAFFRAIQVESSLDQTWIIKRDYGLGDQLSSGFGFTQAVILSLFFFYRKENGNILLFLGMLLTIVSIAINVRTGLVIGMGGILLSLIGDARTFLKNTSLIIVLFLIGFYFLSKFVSMMNVYTLDTIVDSYYMISDLLTGAEQAEGGTVDALTGSFIVWPEGIDWIFGSGENIFNRSYRPSDEGWFIDLNWGGLVYCILLYNIVVMYVRQLKWKRDKKFILFFIFAFLIINTKGKFINYPTYSLLTMTTFYISILNNPPRWMVQKGIVS